MIPKHPPKTRRKHWEDRVKASVPNRETLASSRWLKPFASQILDPKLWHAHHEAVARGVAIGLFWAFAIPVAQFVVAAAHSVWWRANIPVAAGMTLITNPFTIGFWLWLAYQIGGLVLGTPPTVPMPDGAGLMQWLGTYGGPAILGMAVLAFATSISGYFIVKLVWRLRVWFRRRNR